jgi:hypothetical protein
MENSFVTIVETKRDYKESAEAVVYLSTSRRKAAVRSVNGICEHGRQKESVHRARR